jgi:hypothetical protein
MPTNRCFPPPWTVEDIGACFLVKDSSGLAVGRRERSADRKTEQYR